MATIACNLNEKKDKELLKFVDDMNCKGFNNSTLLKVALYEYMETHKAKKQLQYNSMVEQDQILHPSSRYNREESIEVNPNTNIDKDKVENESVEEVINEDIVEATIEDTIKDTIKEEYTSPEFIEHEEEVIVNNTNNTNDTNDINNNTNTKLPTDDPKINSFLNKFVVNGVNA